MPLIRRGDDGRNRDASKVRRLGEPPKLCSKHDGFTPIIVPLIKIEIAAYGRKPPWTMLRRFHL